jgi:hypothetical protein
MNESVYDEIKSSGCEPLSLVGFPETLFDFCYIDPPFGGPDYKTFTGLDLFLKPDGEDSVPRNIIDIIIEMFRNNITNKIFLKSPINYNFYYINSFNNLNYKTYNIMSQNKRKTIPDYMLLEIVYED